MRAITGSREVNLSIGDITMENVDAIVNAANSRLVSGGGVDGAIHKKAGPTLTEFTQQKHPDGCPTGSAVITMAGLLPCRYVIHAVGPRWEEGDYHEAELLAGAYRRSMELAAEYECHSIAFPAISTGAYRYPVQAAAKIALEVVRDFESPRGLPDDVRFVLFTKGTYDHFVAALRATEGYEIDA